MSDAPKLRAIKPEVDAEAVRALEEWLEQAKRGEIIGVRGAWSSIARQVRFWLVGCRCPTHRACIGTNFGC